MNCFSTASCFIVPCSLYLFLFLACPLKTIYIVWPKERRRCLGWMEEEQRGGEVEREMLQLWGDKTTEQHLTCGLEEGGHEACGGCTQWHCYKGGKGVQLIRFGEMDHSLKSPTPGRLGTEHPCQCIWLCKMEESKMAKINCKSKGSQVVLHPRSG